MTIFIDFETYYDAEYSLRKMTYIEYVRDPRFKILGCAIAIENRSPFWLTNEAEIYAMLDLYRRAGHTFVAHNAQFDGFILKERLNVHPKTWGDTLAMARAVLPLDSHSLDSVAKALRIGAKVEGYLTQGANEADAKLIEGALQDVSLCRDIYNRLLPFFPESELQLVDLTTRWAVDPKLVLDKSLLETIVIDETAKRDKAILDSGYTSQQLGSNPQFARILRCLDIPVPTKISVNTEDETEAFAKGDPEFQALMASYPEHAPLWEGRLAAKSTIGIDRPAKLLGIARQDPRMPMPLNYYKARTGRWTGGGGLNVQNLPRLDKSLIRNAFRAPKGHKVVVADSSQIELRVNLWFCRQLDKLSIIAEGGDVYKAVASARFGVPIHAVTKVQRSVAKALVLGCGYGMGWKKFRDFCAAGPLGMAPILLSDQEAYQAVETYRATHPLVRGIWYHLQECLSAMTLANCEIALGPVTLRHQHISLPNGMAILYTGLRQDEQGSWVYGIGKKNYYLFGGKGLENIVQALARIVISDQLLAFEARYPGASVSTTHDEIIAVVPTPQADQALEALLEIMRQPPSWAPDLPLDAEGETNDFYSK